jgi:hypothetical protein
VSRRQFRGGAHNEAAFNQRFHIVHSTIECIGVAGARVTNISSISVDWAEQEGSCMNEAVGRRVGTGMFTLTGAETLHPAMQGRV